MKNKLIILSTTILLCSCTDMPYNVSGYVRDEHTGAKAGIRNGTWFAKAPVNTGYGQTGYIEISGK